MSISYDKDGDWVQTMVKVPRAQVMVVMVEPGTVMARHLIGREADGRSVGLLGQQWIVTATGPTSGGGMLAASLTPVRSETVRMCDRCGSFKWDRVNLDDPVHCSDCGSRELVEEQS